ncbi:MAG TPA: alanine--tRNA ligase [Phycisphaerae bacterium]|nr:alanine--tRNA ligase [Phycisphaerae bacterium]HOM52802.1 alanine--tRNA ligase [Phycisphaerae bacterium]HPP28569.1 alanine--tRNA ligase [Phycisphaerae bacterium]HPU25835.1 alanine--tRNA ligase [Phycisphaerae bacterium]HQE26129.1 alanine--tRNA ligase [Phycisphaerae bacterium]
MRTSDQIRREFIEFFVGKAHTAVPSAPVVPVDDPTLMFTNAGMNQFKDVFLGTGSRPYRRAVDTQKCIRVSGKHNDLEEVGRDTYHHTFFEMLGNWSFGDYFKKEAIAWAWELLTQVWGLPKDRLYATVFAGDEHEGLDADEEAAKLWTEVTDIDPAHVRRFGKKDNFWEMGATGPCGPCSEIHIDLTPDKSGGKLVNAGDPRVMEIWNLVFIQFNRDESGKLTPLPARHVDTGMGFERIVAVLQGKQSNYDTDVFAPLLGKIGELTGHAYTGAVGPDAHVDNAMRVIADHVRMLTFSITDGAKPSNDGRGYVLRRLLRRAARFGRQQLGQTQPFIHKLVPTIVETMGDVFPELKGSADRVMQLIREEEESFGRTLDRGIALFEQAAKSGKTISAADAFKLYDTYGFPIDLTVQMAGERGMSVDETGFADLMAEAKEKARAAAKQHVVVAVEGELPPTQDSPKYLGRAAEARVLGWVVRNAFISSGSLTEADGQTALVLDKTCFYAEQGGQIGDTGQIRTGTGVFEVMTTQRLGDTVLHVGQVTDGTVEAGQAAQLEVAAVRDLTRKNHTATHLLHWALRTVLGEHVKQHGSVVDPERLRFDFDHNAPMTADEIAAVERLVNEKIYADLDVSTRELPIDEARKLPGVRAFFGEKYGDVVRVVSIGPDSFSAEFCGGTHLERTGQIGFFKIVAEEGIAKGVRRVTAVTGPRAVEHVQQLERTAKEAAGLLNTGPEQLPARIAAMQEEIKKLRKQLTKGAAADVKGVRQKLLEEAERVNGAAIIVGELPEVPVEQIREAADWLRSQAGSAAVCLGVVAEGKPMLIAAVTDDLIAKGVKAGDLIKHIVPAIDGRGGGKPNLAQAGGNKPEGIPDALAAASAWVRERLS